MNKKNSFENPLELFIYTCIYKIWLKKELKTLKKNNPIKAKDILLGNLPEKYSFDTWFAKKAKHITFDDQQMVLEELDRLEAMNHG